MLETPRMPAQRFRKRAFTLVELLVVIGIIAVLIGVLLPALNKARAQANNVKCQTQLREIGNAINLYVAENRGYLPPLQHKTAFMFPPAPDTDLGTPQGQDRNDYWYMFLLKYFSKVQYTDNPGKRLRDYKNTPLWGCPVVDKDKVDAGSSSEDFDSGYGYSPYGRWTERTSRSANASSAWPHVTPPTATSPAGRVGRYHKLSQYTRIAERGIIADSRSWLLEIIDFTYPAIPPQNVSTVGYIAGGDQFDRYRHGKWKKTQSFNVLYCDGHVANLTDIRQGWIAMRRNVPPAVAPG